jgi:hypothetical protein
LTPDARAELVVSGNGVVGLAFTRQRALILATSQSLFELYMGIEGRPLIQ